MKKKLLITLLLAVCCFAAVFASNQVRTTISPYSFQRISSSAEEFVAYDTDYGYGMKLAYLHQGKRGLTYGAEVGVYDYYIPESRKNYILGCVESPLYAKFGYYSPLDEDHNYRFFLLADLGGRILHVNDKTNFDFSVGAEIGLSRRLGKNFCLILSGEPQWAFSNFENSPFVESGNDENFTDFVCPINIGLGIDF